MLKFLKHNTKKIPLKTVFILQTVKFQDKITSLK